MLRLDPGVPAAAPRIARSDAGTSRCRDSSAESNTKSEEHLRKSLTYDPNSTVVALLPRRDAASTMDERTRRANELQKLIDAPVDPDWAPRIASSRRRAGRCSRR